MLLAAVFASAPYNFSGTAIAGSFALGTNTLTAVATDNLGATTTSAPVHVIIARYLPPITNGTINILLQPVATNLAAPDYAFSPPGDTSRLFVVGAKRTCYGLFRMESCCPRRPLKYHEPRDSRRWSRPIPTTSAAFLGLAFHPGFNNPASPCYQTLFTYNSEPIPVGTLPTYPGARPRPVNNYKNVLNEWKISSTNAECR